MNAHGNRALWVGLVVVVLSGIFLSVRSHQAMTAVFAAQEEPVLKPDRSASDWVANARRLQAKDSLLALAVPADRDPFGEPARAPAPQRTYRPPPARRVVPEFAALLFDRVDPSVKLRTPSETSAWLHVGDSFAGWTVVEITEAAVTISKGDERVVVRSSSF